MTQNGTIATLTVLYPSKENASFDWDYYTSSHIPLVESLLSSHGLDSVSVDRGVPAADGSPAPFTAIARLVFPGPDSIASGIAEAGPQLMADIRNFTPITPVLQVSVGPA